MVDQIAFRNALACFASGVTVVTAPGDGQGPVGVTVSAFCSLSLDPPLILVCLDNRTGCIAQFLESGAGFTVNVLAADQHALSDAFAGPQTFDLHGHGFKAGATCHTHAIHDGGDHRIVVGRVADVQVARDKTPLIYFQSSYRGLSERI